MVTVLYLLLSLIYLVQWDIQKVRPNYVIVKLDKCDITSMLLKKPIVVILKRTQGTGWTSSSH